MSMGHIDCESCGKAIDGNRFKFGLCDDCMASTPGKASSCPSCDCPLVQRIEGLFGEWQWIVSFNGHASTLPIHWCPEHGCDLEAEFHLRLKSEKARRP